MEGQRNIQVSLNDNTKTVGLTLSTTEDNWNSLTKKVCEAFEINGPANLTMQYVDEEGDLVSLDSDNELRQALQVFNTKTPQFAATLLPVSIKDQQRKLSREERLQKKAERVKARQEKLERKKLRVAMKPEWKLRQEEDPTARPILDDEELASKKDRLAKKQERLARREERLKLKAERLARRQRGDIAPGDDESRKPRREERAQMKLLKLQQKDERRREKMARREERLKRKAAATGDAQPEAASTDAPTKLSREERRALREQKRAKCPCRDGRRGGGRRERPDDGLTFYSLDDTKTWPENTAQLYLDGNNMMYLTAKLRSLTLNRASGKAEALLESVADTFVTSMGDRVKQVVLIFDHTRTDKIKTFDNGATLRVCSARPKFATSDDALIAWAKAAQEEKEHTDRMTFVTSDRALSVQLQQAGGILIKPKQFLYFACTLATGAAGEANVDAWLASLVA